MKEPKQLKIERKHIEKTKEKKPRSRAREDKHQSHVFIPESTNIMQVGSNYQATLLLGNLDLVRFLLTTKFKHCRSCGGINPEINFEIGDKKFWFTLWKISEKGETIIETDYSKFYRFLHASAHKKDE